MSSATTGWSSWLADTGRTALDLVVPQECAGCGRPGRAWCPACIRACAGPALVVPGGPVPGWAASVHDGPAGRAAAAFKDGGARRAAGPLSGLLARAVRAALAGSAWDPAEPVWLVPVPTRRAARRARGGDHMQVLSGRAARLLRRDGVAVHRLTALRHVRSGRDQVGLSREQRRRNLAGALAAGDLPGGRFVVVDDVTTTGATLAEAVRAVRHADGLVVATATVTWARPARHLASPGPWD